MRLRHISLCGVCELQKEMFQKWIRKGLRKPGKDQSGLASVLGIDRTVVSKIVRGSRQLKASEIEIIARYLGEAPPDRIMPISYYIGAGQQVFYLDQNEPLEYVAVSGMWGVECELAIVRGDSMWPFLNEGDRIYIGPARPPIPSDHGQRRVVRLADDRMLVKVMKRTHDPSVWTLDSFNGPSIEDQVVLAVAHIIRIEPAA